MENMVPYANVELEPYTFAINGEPVKYNSHNTVCEIDVDGDLMLDFVVDDSTLLDIIEDETIIAYLENNGYVVTEDK
jgi:uncharacterized protein YjiK